MEFNARYSDVVTAPIDVLRQSEASRTDQSEHTHPRQQTTHTRRADALAERLGVTETSTVAVLGGARIAELAAALANASRVVPWEADLVLTAVTCERELEALPGWLNECGVVAPVWVLVPLDRPDAPGLRRVSRAMAAAGHLDSSSTSVARDWSACCFHRRADAR